jgi:selenocysteine lyase/cysteine desulfurase
MLAENGLTTARISAQVEELKTQLGEALQGTPLGEAEWLNEGEPARFMALRHPRAAEWQAALLAQDCITDVRGDVLRIGLGLYHDQAEVERFAALARTCLPLSTAA